VDILSKIRQKSREAKRPSPLDFLFNESQEEDDVEAPVETEEATDLLNITHLGEVPLEELAAPVEKEIVELNTENPSKIRYLKLIVALIENSNYDAAISAITELSEGSCGSERSSE
jgi:hypothetical protein